MSRSSFMGDINCSEQSFLAAAATSFGQTVQGSTTEFSGCLNRPGRTADFELVGCGPNPERDKPGSVQACRHTEDRTDVTRGLTGPKR